MNVLLFSNNFSENNIQILLQYARAVFGYFTTWSHTNKTMIPEYIFYTFVNFIGGGDYDYGVIFDMSY